MGAASNVNQTLYQTAYYFSERWFGLTYSDVVHETVPLVIGQPKASNLSEIVPVKKN